MKNLGLSLIALFIISLGSITAATIHSNLTTTSISCDKDGDKCCKKKKKCKKKDKKTCKGKETESSTQETK